MDRVIVYNLEDDLVGNLADLLCEKYRQKKIDFSRVACVFGGKRAGFFLHRALASKIKRPYMPPEIFTIDDFVDYMISKKRPFSSLPGLDSFYFIYKLAKQFVPYIIKGDESFAGFLPWAQEIATFIEQLDLEVIDEQTLRFVEKSADIGYEIPPNINRLLGQIVELRQNYHKLLRKNNQYSRGMKYLEAAEYSKEISFDEFDTIFFCGLFYLHSAEKKLIKNIFDRGKACLVFQGDSRQWSVLDDNARFLRFPIRREEKKERISRINFYQGFDIHSQVCIAREIIRKIDSNEKTVIVVPRTEMVIPLLSEISPFLKQFNVSMGYPLNRSPLYVLFALLFKAQLSKRKDKYYTKDYLNLIKHPLVKNLSLKSDFQFTRVLADKIEESIQGDVNSSIGGSLFLSLEEIESEETVYPAAKEALSRIGREVKIKQCRDLLFNLHNVFFRQWEGIDNFHAFSLKLKEFIDMLIENSVVGKFSFNLKVIDKLYNLSEELSRLSFSHKKFSQSVILDVFQKQLERIVISFSGAPLEGTQILGLLETRCLNFDNVIIIDVNESILPKLNIYEPLIPRLIMLNLGLNRLEKEEEIQRYHFTRLVKSAKNCHIIFAENELNEKSRYVEGLLWERQRKAKSLDAVSVPRAVFSFKNTVKKRALMKSGEMIQFLKEQCYSASRIDVYLNCPAQFYYKYVLGLERKEELLSDPDASFIGTFIHELLKETFLQFKGKTLLIDAKFKKYFFKKMARDFEEKISRRMRADAFLLQGILDARFKKFLDKESQRRAVRIISLEEQLSGKISFREEMNFRYTIDRIDQYPDGTITILDYKTGSAAAV
ncbi:MAG: PD-(D/E)XK nuclease family protein, partial [Candidatus Omnitrophota bacterium]